MLEAFKVGVTIALYDKVTAGLFGISRAFAKTHGDAKKLQKQLDGIKFTVMAGGAAASAGFLGLYALKGPLEQANLLQQAQARFAGFGLGPLANAEALRFAESMGIAGSSYVDNMNRMIEAQGVFRESGKLTMMEQLRGAKLAAPLLAKMDFAGSVLNTGQAASFHASALSMMRFVETRGGVNNPAAFNRIANLGWKAIQSSGGNVSWELYRQFMATGGSAAQGLTNQSLFGQFEPLIGELKSRAGVAWMTSYNRLEGITRVPNQLAHLFVDNGLWRKNDVIWNSLGGIKRFRDNKSPLVNHASFESAPVSFYRDTMLPLYAKMHLDQGGRTRENAMIFGRTGGMLFNLIDRQLPAILRSVDAQNKALGIDQSYKVASNTAMGQQVILRKHLNDLEASAGSAILPMMVSGLKTLNPMLWALSTWTREHPKQLQALMLGFTGLSTAMAFGGTVLLLKGAFQGLDLALPGLRAALLGNAAVLDGPAGMTSALWKARLGMLGMMGALAGIYYVASHPVSGKFDKGHEGDITHFRPDWVRNSWWGRPLFGAGATRGQSPNAAMSLVPWSQRNQNYSPTDLAAAVKSALSGLTVQMDGKPVGRIVAKHIDNTAGGPGKGPSRFDPLMMPVMPDHAY